MRILILALSLCIFGLNACEETEEACLDLLAENFSFQAVNACDSCCSYPTVSLNLQLVNDSLSFSLNDTIAIGNGDSLILKEMALVFSKFEFGKDAQSYRIRDSLVRNGVTIRDDYVLFLGEGSRSVGTTAFEDSLVRLSCLAGFEDAVLDRLKPFDQLNQSSKLDLALDSLYDETTGRYFESRFDLEFTFRDSLVQLEMLNSARPLAFSLDRYVSAGMDWKMDIKLDVRVLFNGLQLSQTKEVMEETIRANYPAAIAIE